MRPIIFHAFGKAKLDAPAQLARLARQGWETLPIALLGMPHYPAAWSFEAWKPIGGCCFTGGPSALTGNSAFRFCLLLQWHAIAVPSTALFQDAGKEEDTDVESARTVSEPDQDFLARSLLAAATDQNSRECGSSLPEGLLLALCVLFPECPVSATLGAIAMPKGVLGALKEIASPGPKVAQE